MKNNLLCDVHPAGNETNLGRNVKNGGERSKDGGAPLLVSGYSLIDRGEANRCSVEWACCGSHPESLRFRDEGSDTATALWWRYV